MAKPNSSDLIVEMPAPEISVSRWFNAKSPITLESLRGRVVLLHAFQMLCPGCVSHGIPQAEKAARMFRNTDLAVIGLHTVFEHHAAMTPVALEAFLHEYRITHPVGVDKEQPGSTLPTTMERYQMRGTPTTILIGRDGRMAYHGFGQQEDLAIGMLIGSLLVERQVMNTTVPEPGLSDCADGVCVPAK